MLSEEDQERMVARLQGNAEEVSADFQGVTREPEVQYEETVEEEDTSVDAAEVEDQEEEEDEEGHAVPYSRFRQVNERRKDLQTEIANRDRHLEELQAQLNQKFQQAEQPNPSYEYEEEHEEADPDSWAARFTQMETVNQDMQVKLAQMDLQKEIAQATDQFPNVPEAYIWESIAQNGQLSAQNVAQQYNSFVAEVEEAAIARYLEEQNVEEEPRHGVPPRPSSHQTTGTEHEADPLQPRNLDEAREAMVRYLQLR